MKRHSPCVSGAHNAIVTSRAGKDLVSSLVSGLLTIGPRFGGAIDDAARRFQAAVDAGRAPDEYVEWMKRQGERVPGIGHRIKSKDNRDARVALLQAYARKFFPATKYLDYAVQVSWWRRKGGRKREELESFFFCSPFSLYSLSRARELTRKNPNTSFQKKKSKGRGVHPDESGQPRPQRRRVHRRAVPGPAVVVRDVLRGEKIPPPPPFFSRFGKEKEAFFFLSLSKPLLLHFSDPRDPHFESLFFFAPLLLLPLCALLPLETKQPFSFSIEKRPTTTTPKKKNSKNLTKKLEKNFTKKTSNQAEVREVVRIGYLNGLFVLARAIGLIGHALDQQRLRQPLYRHPW